MQFRQTAFIIFILASFSLFSQEGEKESDATWEETIDWLETKINLDELTSKYFYVNIENDVLTVQRNYMSGSGWESYHTHKIDLKLIQSCSSYHEKLTLGFPEKIKTIETTIYSNKRVKKTSSDSYLYLHFRDDRELLPRLEKAFNHLIMLAKEARKKETLKEKF